MMAEDFPGVEYSLDKTDWLARLPNRSEIWFGGLDDKERTEKVLGQEHSTLYLNEISQIPLSSRNIAVTRLAQLIHYERGGEKIPLRRKMFYDCNPPSKGHWSYRMFVKKRDPETHRALSAPDDYALFHINPIDNLANLPEGYMQTLEGLPARLRTRFLEGVFCDEVANAYWTTELIDKWRVTNDIPEMQRILIAVDPSGSGDTDNADNDAIGIAVCGLGTDGNGYLMEDLTIKAGPGTWGRAVVNAFERHNADAVVGEVNYGGDMVRHVIQSIRPRTPFIPVTATRGKVVRSEPIASLCETGKIRFIGYFHDLEDELCAFTSNGYIGDKSPNRADAFIWGMYALFAGIVREDKKPARKKLFNAVSGQFGWLNG